MAVSIKVGSLLVSVCIRTPPLFGFCIRAPDFLETRGWVDYTLPN